MIQVTEEKKKNGEDWICQKLQEYKEYFDHMLEKIDPGICLDEEQRRAILQDDDNCLLIAGAGAR